MRYDSDQVIDRNFSTRSPTTWHLGIDLHRRTVVIAAINDAGEVRPAVRFECSQPEKILHYCEDFGAFRCVNEATSTYRWLYKLLLPAGAVLLTRIRKRSSAKIARVAAARKPAEICRKRLRRWHREHSELAAV